MSYVSCLPDAVAEAVSPAVTGLAVVPAAVDLENRSTPQLHGWRIQAIARDEAAAWRIQQAMRAQLAPVHMTWRSDGSVSVIAHVGHATLVDRVAAVSAGTGTGDVVACDREHGGIALWPGISARFDVHEVDRAICQTVPGIGAPQGADRANESQEHDLVLDLKRRYGAFFGGRDMPAVPVDVFLQVHAALRRVTSTAEARAQRGLLMALWPEAEQPGATSPCAVDLHRLLRGASVDTRVAWDFTGLSRRIRAGLTSGRLPREWRWGAWALL